VEGKGPEHGMRCSNNLGKGGKKNAKKGKKGKTGGGENRTAKDTDKISVKGTTSRNKKGFKLKKLDKSKKKSADQQNTGKRGEPMKTQEGAKKNKKKKKEVGRKNAPSGGKEGGGVGPKPGRISPIPQIGKHKRGGGEKDRGDPVGKKESSRGGQQGREKTQSSQKGVISGNHLERPPETDSWGGKRTRTRGQPRFSTYK